MKKIVQIIGVIVVIVVAAVSLVSISPQEDTIQIGISKWIEDDEYNNNIQGFKNALHEFLPDQDIRFTIKNSNADKTKQLEIAKEFSAGNVDLIYSLTTPGTTIIKKIIHNTPIVFSIVTFPQRAGLVETLESSKNNLVGTSNYMSIERQLEMIVILSDVKTLGFVHRENEVNSDIQFSEFQEMGSIYDIEIINLEAKNLVELEIILNDAIVNVDGFYQACDTLIQSGGEEIAINIAMAYHKPTFSCNKEGVQKGALAGEVADFYMLGYEAGKKAVDILNGKQPSDIPTSFQTEHNIMINQKTADFLEIDISREKIRATIIE